MTNEEQALNQAKFAMGRILSLSLIKDDPDDDFYDTLRKIGDVAHQWLTSHHSTYAEFEAHKVNKRFDDDRERESMWSE